MSRPPAPDSASSSVMSSGPGPLGGLGGGGSAAYGSSSSNTPSRADQITYRFYIKTVSVLVDGRVTHFGKGERKKDRWFNLTVPDTDVHKADLTIYRQISSYTEVPPLMIAFILDTTDIPAGQGIIWNPRPAGDGSGASVRVPIDVGKRKGIVLEQWTFKCSRGRNLQGVTEGKTSINLHATQPKPMTMTSEAFLDEATVCVAQPPPAHCQPSHDGLQHAAISTSDMAPPTAYRVGIVHFRALYSFIRLLPAYRLFRRLRRQNNGLRLGIKLWAPDGYPADALGEAWDVIERDLAGIKVPLDNLSSATGSETEHYDFAPLQLFGSTYELGVTYRPNVDFEVEDLESVLSERFVDMDEEWFTPTVARHRLESERSGAGSGSNTTSRSASRAGHQTPSRRTSIVVSGTPGATPGSLGAGKWSAMAEGLPFAIRAGAGTADEPPSPQATIPAYRRLSAHSLQPFQSISASPTASVLRGQTPNLPSSAGAAARAIPSSAGSQPMARTSSFLSQSGRSHSHAQMASMQPSTSHETPTHQGTPPLGPPIGVSPPTPFPASPSVSKRASIALASSSPFVGGSLERDSPLRRGSLGRSPNSPMLRRTYTRESRRSLDEPSGDSDDIHAFLRALDSWTPPASVGQGSGNVAGSSGSGQGSSGAADSPARSVERDRVPLTRTHVDDMLKRMAGSFQSPTPGSNSGPSSASNTGSRRSSLSGPSLTRRPQRLERPGLLSASRPVSTASSPAPTRGISTLAHDAEPEPEADSSERGLTRTSTVPVQAAQAKPKLGSGEARSLPSETPLRPPRGPMVVRGGFGALKVGKPCSPSHSPVRDRGERKLERELPKGVGGITDRSGGVPSSRESSGDKPREGSLASQATATAASGETRPGIQRIRSSVASGGRGSLSRSAGSGSQQSPVFEGLMAKLAQSKLDAQERERKASA
ncbi:hypothetical protein A1Q1_03194 [Trichosporon asahii var. asahii CBS 2479]|uniref:Autophagy-related protein 13 n=1 Tax=Trichosporon asahii var. asahii (strain ATCC 90039 / CBS 2479 / JCM 2466 / KCTC 7840 / NBRC 103889/ NCYC 2677 / UAMH 7654) TaxID=1186058 RepID=J5QKX5_TRIAS|nr:hypothetical protein A1Q1_03194 [Trichosporon asahii var. asahii CBS 2479]EJT47888.1 hypothetical protein A1Q1_03194 [Trichosporon asahii var. asahii CBS 2479]